MPSETPKKKASTAKTAPKKKTAVKAAPKAAQYVESVGRRKTSTARVRLVPGPGNIVFLGNTKTPSERSQKKRSVEEERTLERYFPLKRLQEIALAPLVQLDLAKKFDISVRVNGGGITSQAGAVRLGIARALVKTDPELKTRLRALGFLTRDPRMVERKKYGLKKARRSPQWSKR